MKPPATPEFQRRVNSFRIESSVEAKRRAVERFRQKHLDLALRRALRRMVDEEFKLERPAP